MSATQSVRLLRILLLLLLLAALLLTGLIVLGAFDPQPYGRLQQTTPEIRLILHDGENLSVWQQPLTAPLPPPPFTIRAAVRRTSGESDLLHGVLLAGDDQQGLLVAVSPLGELGIWHPVFALNPVLESALFPRQPWPHVRRDGQLNEIRIDAGAAETVVRINGELAWRGAPLASPTRLYLWGRSFGGGAEIVVPWIQLYAPDAP